MIISLILAHPNKESFNHAIAAKAMEVLNYNGHIVNFHDLHKEGFDPILPYEEFLKDSCVAPAIKKHCEEISVADGIIIVHPNWWGQPPAILKGWVDRVIRPGIAYEFNEGDEGEGIPKGLLKADSAIVFNTSNTESKREAKMFGDPLETIWKNCIFGLCGVDKFYRNMFNIIAVSNDEQRRAWLNNVEEMINDIFPKG
ncbi:MAG: NAD(P)H-dependent oxidoreductase [Candidatus Omnitrophica bacterium]|nr:NAD(P)H-dependent oxidoreductase [Candidatus Omnitrophota bacterium]